MTLATIDKQMLFDGQFFERQQTLVLLGATAIDQGEAWSKLEPQFCGHLSPSYYAI